MDCDLPIPRREVSFAPASPRSRYRASTPRRHPEEIERAIGSVDGVDKTRVYGKPDPSCGEIVVADLVLGKGFEQDNVLSRIRSSLETTWAKYKVPRVFNFVDSIDV
ncbi:hypothetical protein [Bradyrhizobium sp. S3.5.5]|uniref:AMP-binding enzyme n=1 Tax=Bradyrhizobium sp. S3.5.5 TaxID=3156430 RepID=UPI0033994958